MVEIRVHLYKAWLVNWRRLSRRIGPRLRLSRRLPGGGGDWLLESSDARGSVLLATRYTYASLPLSPDTDSG